MSQKRPLTRLAELLGLVGVIGSLVFVGVEVRQSAIATRAATDASISDAFRELNQVVASSPELARALTSYQENPGGAAAADQIQIRAMWRSVFHVWSNAHRQHLNGTIDPAIFASVVQEITFYAEAAPGGAAAVDVVRRGRLLRWALGSGALHLQPGLPGVRRQHHPAMMANDAGVLDLIVRRSGWLSISIGELTLLREELEQIGAMIKSELDGS